MTATENQELQSEDQSPLAATGPYNPVTVTMQDTWGAIFLGMLSVVLLIGWLLSEKRNRKLVNQINRKADDPRMDD